MELIERGNTTSLKRMIVESNIILTQVRDDKGFSLLHHAVLKYRSNVVKFLIEYSLKEQKEDEDILQDWINSKTNKEKFTPLHFASFKGDLRSA